MDKIFHGVKRYAIEPMNSCDSILGLRYHPFISPLDLSDFIGIITDSFYTTFKSSNGLLFNC